MEHHRVERTPLLLSVFAGVSKAVIGGGRGCFRSRPILCGARCGRNPEHDASGREIKAWEIGRVQPGGPGHTFVANTLGEGGASLSGEAQHVAQDFLLWRLAARSVM